MQIIYFVVFYLAKQLTLLSLVFLCYVVIAAIFFKPNIYKSSNTDSEQKEHFNMINK